MERELFVSIDVDGVTVPVGRLWARARSGRESSSFEYERGWLVRRGAFALDPELPLTTGPFHTERPLFNALADPAPDRWGQTLLRRHERARARAEDRQPRTLFAVDFLTLVDDETRLGALRVSERPGGPFLSDSGRRAPPLLQLPKLLAATTRVLDDRESSEDLHLMLAPGTSLGGARPKASVRDASGQLLVAKFPKKDDEWPVTRWEAATLKLADAAGVRTPKWKLQLVARRPVLMLWRFDRVSGRRLPFMSAMTALAATEREQRGYVDLVDALRQGGSAVEADSEALWRRLVFNLLVSNTDDHLRNHGFLHDGRGWRLAPAYDVNPMPADVRPRVHALALAGDDPAAPFDAVLAEAPRFGLTTRKARSVAREVATAVKGWRKAAASMGLTAREIERMESAFEHDDLAAAAR